MAAFIQFLKLLFSKDFRIAVGELLETARAPSAWKQGFLIQKARIRRVDRELSNAYCEAMCAKMKERNFSVASVADFRTAFAELVLNAFSYGCDFDRDFITLRTTIFNSGIALEVINRKKLIPITLDKIKKKGLELGGPHVTGRGLPLVFSISDQIEFVSGGRGVKVVMYDHDVSYDLCDKYGVQLIIVGNYLGDYIEKIRSALLGATGDVVVLFSEKVQPLAASIAFRSFDEIQKSEPVARFAGVMDQTSAKYLLRVKQHFPKFVGFYPSIETAILALNSKSKSSSKKIARKEK